jgi:hypothetical protein
VAKRRQSEWHVRRRSEAGLLAEVLRQQRRAKNEKRIKRVMKRITPAASPDAYVEALDGWHRKIVETLRSAVRAASGLQEVVKWGHLVYLANGPVLLIRAEESRVLLGFWRGQRLRAIEPRLKPGGKYEMATLDLREGMTVTPATVRRLTRESVALDRKLGDPRHAARPRRVLSATARGDGPWPGTTGPAYRGTSVNVKNGPAAQRRGSKAPR